MTSGERSDVVEGGCTCRAIRYRLRRKPIVVHCCHGTAGVRAFAEFYNPAEVWTAESRARYRATRPA